MSIKNNSSDVAVGCMLILYAPILATWQAYAFMTLWGWFVVPLFALPVLTLGKAYGLMLTVSAMRYFGSHDSASSKSDDANKKTYVTISVAVLAPAVALLVGYCIK